MRLLRSPAGHKSVSLCWRQLCPLANVIDKPDNSFCHWSLHLIYCRESHAGCSCGWFFLLGYALTLSQDCWHGEWSNSPCTSCWVPHCTEPRAADAGDWVTRLKSLFAACWEVLIQKEVRNSHLVFRWKSAMHNEKKWLETESLVMPEQQMARCHCRWKLC